MAYPNEEIDITKGQDIHDRALKKLEEPSIAHSREDVIKEQNIYTEPKDFKPYMRSSLANRIQDAAYEDMVGGNNPIENIGVLGQNDSYYDQYIQSREDLEDLNEVRAREQGFISKISGGLGKFVTITAAGTVGNIVGTVAGILEGFDNIIEGDPKEGNGWDRFWTGFWSNKVNTYMNDIIKSAEEVMPVYESKAYQNAGFLDRVFSANFLSNYIANMGWTSAAILSTVLTGGMGAASLGSSIARSLGASKNAANWVYRLIGACTSSMAEASTEAINNYDEAKQDYYNIVSSDYRNQKAALDAEMQQYYQSEIERLGLQQNPEQEPIRVNGLTVQEALWKDVQNEYSSKYTQLESDYERKLATIEDNAVKAGTNTFGANVFWLTLSNSMGVFSNISTPMSNINRVARGSWKNIFKAAGQKEGISRGELLAREALEAISQGNEEMVQKGAAETAKAYYGQYYNPEFTGQMRDYFDIAGEQYANVYKDPRAWEEFASGMFLGISGTAGAGHKSRKTEDGKVKQGIGFEWTGGLINAIKESKEVSERSKQLYDDANKIYNDFSKDKNLQARARMVIGVLADKDEMAKAVDNADKKAFLDHEGEQWLRICETFSDIGRMNDLKAMVGQKTDMTDEELREFAAINSEEIKDDKGNGTGRFKSNLPVVDANGELLTNSPDGIKQLRERLQKDQERMNKVIDTYQKTVEDTDAETGYSLSRDQLKVLTWAKMKGLLAEDRQNKIGKELNKKLNWKSLYDAYKNNRTYRDDDKDNYVKFLENEAEILSNIIERYNALENGFTQKSDVQNKSIFESDLKKINQILHTIAGDKKTKEGESKDSLETKDNKSIVDSFFELLDENTKGTLLSALLCQKIGKRGDKSIYFADVVQDILEKEYGDDVSEILDNINDLIKLSSDTRAYDKMFREFVGAPQKIDDMLNETLKKSSDAYIKHRGNQLLNQTDYDIVDNELEKETPENKVKLRDWLRKNNFNYNKHLQSKEYNKELNDNVDNLAANNKITLSGKTKEFINHLIKNKAFYRQKLLYWDRERFVKEAMDAGFNIDESLQLAANMLDLADMAREHYTNNNALTDIIQRANANPEKTKDRFSTGDTKAPKIVSEPNTVIEEIYEYLAYHYLIEGGENEKKSQEKIVKYNLPEKDDNAIIERAKSLVEEINNLCETNPDEVGKNVDNYKKALLVYYNVLSQLHLQYGGRKGGNTIFNILKSIKNTVKRFKGKMIDQHMLTPIMFDDDYQKCFPNMEVEVVEDPNYKLNYALITDIEYSSPDKGKIKLIVPKGNIKQNGITSPAGSGEFTPSDELLRQMEQYKQQVNQQLSETITTSGFTIHNKAEMEQYIKEHGLDNVQQARRQYAGSQLRFAKNIYNKPTGIDLLALSSAIMTQSNTFNNLTARIGDREGITVKKIIFFNNSAYLWSTENGYEFLVEKQLAINEKNYNEINKLLDTYGTDEYTTNALSAIERSENTEERSRRFIDFAKRAGAAAYNRFNNNRGQVSNGARINGDNVSYTDEQGLVQEFTTPDGEIYGFVTPEGEIYIDETKISPEHLIHEYTHLWDKFVREKNPKLWQRGVGLMKQIPLWNEIANSEQYGQKWVKQGKSGNELDNLIASEVHARLVGKNGEKALNQIAEKDKNAQGIVEKLKQWFLDFWKNLKETFSNWTKEEIEKLTLEDFENMTLRDLVDKVDLKNSPNATYTENTTLTDTITGNNAQQQQVLDKIQQVSKTLQDRVFFTEENHTYFIYTKDDVENAKKIFSENKITKENASDYGFTYNTISASKLRYQNEEYNPNTNAEVGSLIGNDIDYIVREYFKGTSKEEILNNLKYLRQLNDDGTVAYDNTDKIFEALPKISEEIKEKYGDNCIIYTEPLNMVAVYNDNTKKIIAGTPDMLVIDEKGVIHVFDMKAKKTRQSY